MAKYPCKTNLTFINKTALAMPVTSTQQAKMTYINQINDRNFKRERNMIPSR